MSDVSYLDIDMWGLKSPRGYLMNCKRVLREDNRPGHGPVLLKTRKEALEYRGEFGFGKEYKPVKIRITDVQT